MMFPLVFRISGQLQFEGLIYSCPLKARVGSEECSITFHLCPRYQVNCLSTQTPYPKWASFGRKVGIICSPTYPLSEYQKVFKKASFLPPCQASEDEADADEGDQRLRSGCQAFVVLTAPPVAAQPRKDALEDATQRVGMQPDSSHVQSDVT